MSQLGILKKLMVISYHCGATGNCPAEWADDKINALRQNKVRSLVITGLSSTVKDDEYIKYVRVPSLSRIDFWEEIETRKANGSPAGPFIFLLLPLIYTFGILVDLILRFITKGQTGGRWSWVFLALPITIFYYLRYRHKTVFTTGGPSSVHVIAGILVKLFGAKLYCEFQDPLMGAMMTRSQMTQSITVYIERWLAKVSQKLVYVTETAAERSRARYPEYSNKLVGIYPGSRNFDIGNAETNPVTDKAGRKLIHLGTLYGSRNLDTLFAAIDSLEAQGKIRKGELNICNQGDIYLENADEYHSRTDFEQSRSVNRLEALNIAGSADGLLLVQHADSRSEETIPYKTYDYLNLSMPILALTNNSELDDLLRSNGHLSANVENIVEIERALLDFLALKHNRVNKMQSNYVLETQFAEIFTG